MYTPAAGVWVAAFALHRSVTNLLMWVGITLSLRHGRFTND